MSNIPAETRTEQTIKVEGGEVPVYIQGNELDITGAYTVTPEQNVSSGSNGVAVQKVDEEFNSAEYNIPDSSNTTKVGEMTLPDVLGQKSNNFYSINIVNRK